MSNSPLEELLIDQLRDVYDAEKQLGKVLPKIAKAASDEELTGCFRTHAEETKGQAGRLEQVFEALGVKAKSKPCEAMKGLIAEAQEVLSEDMAENVMNVALVAAARRVEHYEMAAYDSMVMLAQTLKRADVVTLLKETLQEETDTDKKLVAIGKRLAKEAAKPVAEVEAEEAPKRKASSKSPAQAQSKTATKPAPSKQAPDTKSSSKNGGSRGGSNGKGSSGKENTSDHTSNTTADHGEIREWAEQRGGKPSCVQGTGGKGDIGLLRIEFPGKPNAKDDNLSEISWDEFFDKFDAQGLALIYQEHTAAGEQSNFNKLVTREAETKSKSKNAR